MYWKKKIRNNINGCKTASNTTPNVSQVMKKVTDGMTDQTYSTQKHMSNRGKSIKHVTGGMTDHTYFTQNHTSNIEQSPTKVNEELKTKSPSQKPTTERVQIKPKNQVQIRIRLRSHIQIMS